MMMIPLMLFRKRGKDSNYLMSTEQYTVILSHHLQSSREPSHISNPDFDPPSKLLQNAFSYIHEENEASIDCIYLEENGVEVEIRQVHS